MSGTEPERSVNRVVELAADGAGLRGVFADRAEASTHIMAAVMEANFVKVLSNKGDEWIGPSGMLMDPLLEVTKTRRLPVQILLLHPRSPWLRHRAADKGFWARPWATEAAKFDAAHDEVLQAAESLPEMRAPHFHRHDPSWRFMMTDKEIFLQTYNSAIQIEKEKVLRFSSDSPVWGSALRYFDYVYELDSAEREQISPVAQLDQKKIRHEASAGLVVTRQVGGNREVLLLHQNRMVGLSKGGIKQGESLLDAARRELWEETGAEFWDAEGEFIMSVLVGQPFEDETSVKVLLFFHAHFADAVETPGLSGNARWMDAAELAGAVPAYDYVPEVLARIGIKPRWAARTA